jgi:Na+/phosphate symporter
MTSEWMQASLVIATINIGLTLVLFGLYRRVYAETRSPFGIGLLLFAGAFVVQNLLVLYSYLATMPLIPELMSPYLFSIGVSEAAGLSAIVWTASR